MARTPFPDRVDPASIPRSRQLETPASARSVQDVERYDTISFDVFDTVLTRTVLHPTGVFDLMASRFRGRFRGLRGRIPMAKARILSEFLARSFSRREEVTLDEIYARLGALLGLSNGDLEEIRREELRLETELSVPVKPVVALVSAVRKAGRRVLFISDIYLPEDFVVGLLRNGGVDVSANDVFASSRWMATKMSGSLYGVVAEKRAVPFDGWLHIGDNPESDVRSPRRLGIDACLIRPVAEAPIAERRISSRPTRVRARSENPVSEILAGAVRTGRWNRSDESVSDPAVRLGRELVGPLFLPYVLWALRESSLEGLRRVFFLARDGEVLLRIAEVVERRLGIGLDLRYLAVSRQSLNLPGLGLPGATPRWVFETTVGLTAVRLAGRLHLDPEEIRELLLGMGIVPKGPEGRLAAADMRRLEREFAVSPLGNAAAARAAEARACALLYLEGEGAIGPPAVSLVDLGWRGGLQARLALLASSAALETRFSGHYFGAMSRVEPPEIPRRAFLFDARHSVWPTFAMLQAIGVFETLARATHGTVRRYLPSGGSAVPDFDSGEPDTATARRIHAGACAFVEEIPASALSALYRLPDRDLKRATQRIALRAIFLPPAEEAAYVGAMKFSGEQGETPGDELAPPLRGRPATQAVFSMNSFFPAQKTFWLSASLVRGGSRLATRPGLLLRQAVVAAAYARETLENALRGQARE